MISWNPRHRGEGLFYGPQFLFENTKIKPPFRAVLFCKQNVSGLSIEVKENPFVEDYEKKPHGIIRREKGGGAPSLLHYIIKWYNVYMAFRKKTKKKTDSKEASQKQVEKEPTRSQSSRQVKN